MAIALIASFYSNRATAQSPETRRPVTQALRVRVLGSCLTHRLLSDRIDRWIGGSGVAGDLTIDLTGHETPRVALVFSLSRGGAPPVLRHLQFEPSPCEGLREAVSLVIAMAIDAAAVSRTLADPPVTAPKTLEFKRSLALLANTVVPIGILGDDFAFGAGLSIESWFTERITVDLGISFLPSMGLQIGDGGARLTLLWAHLSACAVTKAPGPRLRLGACGGLFGGRLEAQGTDFSTPRRGTGPWLAVAAGFDLNFVVRAPFELFVRTEGLALIARPSFEVRQAQGAVVASRQLGTFGALLKAGVGLRFQ